MTDKQFKEKCKKNRQEKHKKLIAQKIVKTWSSYQEYLQSKEWLSLRKKKISQVGGSCQICNSRKEIRIHHRTYKRIFHEDLNDLTVLCNLCHELFHNRNNADEYIERKISEMQS